MRAADLLGQRSVWSSRGLGQAWKVRVSSRLYLFFHICVLINPVICREHFVCPKAALKFVHWDFTFRKAKAPEIVFVQALGTIIIFTFPKPQGTSDGSYIIVLGY